MARVKRIRILIVESEPALAALLEEGFEASGHATATVAGGRSAGALAADRECDLVVVDSSSLALNDLDELINIADRRRLPLVFITAPGEVEGRLAGLGLAPQDHVTKPFRFDEVLAQVQRRLERERTFAEVKLSAGPLELDPWTRRARMGGAEAALTGREFALLEFFLRHPGQLLTRDRLHAHVWGYEYDPGSNVIEVYIGYLRRKLGADVIETVHGQGYRLNV